MKIKILGAAAGLVLALSAVGGASASTVTITSGPNCAALSAAFAQAMAYGVDTQGVTVSAFNGVSCTLSIP